MSEADRWWCSEGCGFVDKEHRCEQWCNPSQIPGAAIESLRGFKKAMDKAVEKSEQMDTIVCVHCITSFEFEKGTEEPICTHCGEGPLDLSRPHNVMECHKCQTPIHFPLGERAGPCPACGLTPATFADLPHPSELDPDVMSRILKEAVQAGAKALEEWRASVKNSGCNCCSCRRY